MKGIEQKTEKRYTHSTMRDMDTVSECDRQITYTTNMIMEKVKKNKYQRQDKLREGF